jgi:hypothetical protein
MKFTRAAFAAALTAPLSVLAQRADNGGPYAPIVLLLPSGPRTLAMGNTGVAGRDDDVLFFNPAQLAIARGFSASAERYSPNSGGGALSAVTRFSTGGIAVGMRMVDYQLPLNTYPADRGTMLGDGPAAGTSVEASVGLAQVIKSVRIGVAAKYVEDNVPAIRVGRAAADIGVAKDLFRFYTFGLAVQNIGSSMTVPCTIAHQVAAGTHDCLPSEVPSNGLTSARLPLRTTLGVATARPLGEFDVVATAAVSALRMGWLGVSGGTEVGYSWLDGYSIALRAGGRRPLPGEAPFTAGAGFNMDRLSIDYALETLAGSRVGHRIGLRIR